MPDRRPSGVTARPSEAESSSRVDAGGAYVHGIRQNWRPFLAWTLLTLWVGTVLGVERVAVPLVGASVFGISSYVVLLSFIASFGFVKAATNFLAGVATDRAGRRTVEVLGWVSAVPVPFLLLWAPDWDWVIAANVLVGVSQGLTWTTAVTSQVDLAGPSQRGLSIGINEAAGYGGVTLGGIAAGYLATVELRVAPFEFMAAVTVIALLVSLMLRDTRPWARREADPGALGTARTHPGRLLLAASWQNRPLFACSQAGLIEKFVDTLAWGIVPVYLLSLHYDPVTIGWVVGVYTGSWAILQLWTGALSDRIGRRIPIVVGMLLAALGVGLFPFAGSLPVFLGLALTAGLGMALLYPTLLAAVSDLAGSTHRGTVLGAYRFWRDSGYGFGALFLGISATVLGVPSTFLLAAVIMAASAAFVAVSLGSTRPSSVPGGRDVTQGR